MSSKPVFKKSLKRLVKAVKKLLRKQGGTYSRLEILILISRAFAGILDKVGKWEVILVFVVLYLGFCTRK